MGYTTIDQIGPEAHQIYAERESYGSHFPLKIEEYAAIAPHAEILATSSDFVSKLELLFNLDQARNSWATFSPPTDYQKQKKEFFSYVMSAHFSKCDSEEMKTFIDTKVASKTKELEKEKMQIADLFDSVEWLLELLEEIHANKFRFQKG